jgi:hypothetical protein
MYSKGGKNNNPESLTVTGFLLPPLQNIGSGIYRWDGGTVTDGNMAACCRDLSYDFFNDATGECEAI